MNDDEPTEMLPAVRPGPGPSRRRRLIIAAAVVVAVVAGGTAVLVFRGSGSSGVVTQVTPATHTFRVARTDLTDAQVLPGALGYGAPQPVQGVAGVVTWLPAPGAVVSRNEQLLRIDDRPVFLFYGATPLFRPLDTLNLVGRDVEVVADNLRALGYDIGSQPRTGSVVQPPTPAVAPPSATNTAIAPSPAPSAPPAGRVKVGDAVLTGSLISAIKRWQRATGQPQTGVLNVSDVLVLPAAVRVGAVPGRLGGQAATPLLSVTATVKVITVQADPGALGSVKAGDKVRLGLPGGRSAAGTVTVVAVPAADTSTPDGAGSTEPPKTVITVSPDDAGALGDLDNGSVQVEFTTEAKPGVLAVPVNALLALREGGYAVQVQGGGLAAVTTGLFAKGMVEISGRGVSEGTVVVTP
jgi:hypothetical protein